MKKNKTLYYRQNFCFLVIIIECNSNTIFALLHYLLTSLPYFRWSFKNGRVVMIDTCVTMNRMKHFLTDFYVIWVKNYCVKSVQIRSFSGPYFPAFGLNTERYGVSLRIQSEYGEIRTRKKLRIWTLFTQ